MLILEFVLAQGVIFLVIFLVLRQMMVRNTMSAVNRLRVVDEENARRLEEMKKKIEEAEEAYKRKVQELALELEKQRGEVLKQVEEEKSRMMARSQEEAERILGSAKSRSENIDREMDKALKVRATALSKKIVHQALSGTIKKALNAQLVRELLEEVMTMDIGDLPVQANEVEVILPHLLDPKQREEMELALQKKIGRKVRVREVVNPEMLGGMILRLGSLEIDGSLEGKLGEAASAIAHEE